MVAKPKFKTAKKPTKKGGINNLTKGKVTKGFKKFKSKKK